MAVNDPISDMLTRVRNALMVGKKEVKMPSSKIKVEIARVLQEEGYILGYRSENKVDFCEYLIIDLKYYASRPVVEEIKRISRPGLRVYKKSTDLPKVMNGLGVAIVSTSKGVMTDLSARSQGLGGEVLCTVF